MREICTSITVDQIPASQRTPKSLPIIAPSESSASSCMHLYIVPSFNPLRSLHDDDSPLTQKCAPSERAYLRIPTNHSRHLLQRNNSLNTAQHPVPVTRGSPVSGSNQQHPNCPKTSRGTSIIRHVSRRGVSYQAFPQLAKDFSNVTRAPRGSNSPGKRVMGNERRLVV